MVLLFLVAIIALICWVSWSINTKGRKGLKELEYYLSEIEGNPSNLLAFKRFAETIERNHWIQSVDIFKEKGVYDRILRILDSNFTNHLAFETLMRILSKFKSALSLEERKNRISSKTFKVASAYLDKNPLTPTVHENVIKILELIKVTPSDSQKIYAQALAILENHPDSSIAKQFTLTVGRWHFGKSRSDEKPTIYDEQAIQNDILVRSK